MIVKGYVRVGHLATALGTEPEEFLLCLCSDRNFLVYPDLEIEVQVETAGYDIKEMPNERLSRINRGSYGVVLSFKRKLNISDRPDFMSRRLEDL